MTQRRGFCIDRTLPTEVMTYQPTQQTPDGRTRAILVRRKLWPVGQRLRVRFLGGSAQQQALAQEQAAWWSESANLKFDFGNDPRAEFRVAFDANDGAWSYVGTDCRSIPLDQPTMNLGFMDGGTAGHEFGHAIGLGHEHQNPEGGIVWNERVVIEALAGPPNFWTEEETRHNVLEKYSVDQVIGTQFDARSIMLYFFPGSWVESGIGTEANEVLSDVDREFIGSSRAYPEDSNPPVRLTVNAARRTAGSLSVPGEQDLYTFDVADAGIHVVDTKGATDVTLRLFGPNAETALIAEDFDSGTAANARITASLVAGNYLVQVQHDQPSGTGDYTVRVRHP